MLDMFDDDDYDGSIASGIMGDRRTKRLRSRKAKRDTAIEKSRREEG